MYLFFDLGSTLIDESLCERQSILDTVAGSAITVEEYEYILKEYALTVSKVNTPRRVGDNLILLGECFLLRFQPTLFYGALAKCRLQSIIPYPTFFYGA